MAQKTWPNFFIAGAGRAGTYSLYEYLKNIPGICMSKRKEPRYFSPQMSKMGLFRITDQKQYLAQFKKCKNAIAVGEASPQYLNDPESAKLIHQQIPNAKIILSLRDPVEREYSGFLMRRRKGNAQKDLHKRVQGLVKNPGSSSMYVEKVKRFVDIFGKNQVKILIFEEWIKKPRETVQELLYFLDVHYILPDDFDLTPHNTFYKITLENNTSKILKLILRRKPKKSELKPKMDPKDREKLQNLFKVDVKNLEQFLNLNLPWKNFPN